MCFSKALIHALNTHTYPIRDFSLPDANDISLVTSYLDPFMSLF